MNIRSRFLAPALITLLLAACGGGGISGTYEGDIGAITFASGKADATFMGSTREMDYTVDGNRIVLHSSEGNLVLTHKKDGSLDTPWGTMNPKN